MHQKCLQFFLTNDPNIGIVLIMPHISQFLIALVFFGLFWVMYCDLKRGFRGHGQSGKDFADPRYKMLAKPIIIALGCSRLAYPILPHRETPGTISAQYHRAHTRFLGEIECLDGRVIAFMERWMLLGYSSSIEACRAEALVLLADIDETVEFYRYLTDKFYVSAYKIDPNFDPPTLIYSAKKAIHESRAKIQGV